MLVSALPLALVLVAGSDALQSVPDVQHIYGGEEVGTCGWPSVVSLGQGSCTGVLVHPLIVMTAAHCVPNGFPTSVRFGESVGGAVTLAEVEICKQGPDWSGATAQGQDYAYCKLASPVTAVPIIPVAAGCEQTAIYPGARIMHVGFGVTETGGGGQKKMLDTEVDAVTDSGELISGDGSEIICNGDSGGPTFVYLDPAVGGDGSWRVAAIHSWAQGADPAEPNCFGQAGSVLAANAIDWIEMDSGIDITPCTDGADWSPTYHCGGLPTEPWVGDGGYTSECTSPEVVDFPSVCGPSLAADEVAPTLQILTPTHEQEFASEGDNVAVGVEIDALDDGWGVATIELTVRALGSGGEDVDARNEWQPWAWQLTLPGGTYEVQAVAIDYAGNASEPAVVCFGVDQLECPDDASDSTGDPTGSEPESTSDDGELPPATDTGDADDDGSTGTPPAADDGGGDGCGCRSSRAPGPWSLLGLALFGLRSRRARR